MDHSKMKHDAMLHIYSLPVGHGGHNHHANGSDITGETAGIVLVNSNPKDIVGLVLFGKTTHRKMIRNLIWATGYNVVALPVAASVLYQWFGKFFTIQKGYPGIKHLN
ncbi:MAG: hypothetical protein ABI760_17355 [Ferruginibacter sp.]